jgi:hypothetical protein
MMSEQSHNPGANASALNGISKMTLPQAITLITLRLGKIETQLMNGLDLGHESQDGDNILVDSNIINSLISRIDALEKNPGSTKDTAILKQQFETIKPVVVQSKNSITALKQQIETLKTELNETKELVIVLQNLTMDNNTKIIALNSVFLEESMEVEVDELGEALEVEEESDEENDDGVMGTDLKELIEQEFNLEE